jgi:cupin fold WbuC family metalloprotein
MAGISRIQILDQDLLRLLSHRARQSPRLRANHNFHSNADENPQRFLNVLLRGTYVCPHRHASPPKSESLLVISGVLAFLEFDDHGGVISQIILGSGTMGVDVPPGVWHTVVVLTPEAVCYEVKPGPYCAKNDKEFASWAPREGDLQAGIYLEKLVTDVKGSDAGRAHR